MNHEIWRYIFDAIEDPVFLHDAQFRVLLANSAYCREAGVTEAELLGKPYWEVFPLGSGPLPGCKDAMSGKGHTGSQEELSVGEKIFLSKSYVVCDDQSKLLYALHLLSDITAQKQAATALSEGEERFRRAIENARDAIITIDGEGGVITEWNPAAEIMFGYSKEEVIGRVLHEIITPPRFREAAMKGMAHFTTTGEGAAVNKTLELVALHKNGTEFPIELSLSATQIHGKWFATGITRDITARKQAEESLRKTNVELSLFRKLLDNSNDAIDVVDPITLRYLDVNEKACRDLGYSREELLSMSVFDTDPSLNLDTKKNLDEQLQKLGAIRYEGVHRRKDGSTFAVEVSIGSANFDKPYLLCIVRDITKRKLAETKLAEQLNELQRWNDAMQGREDRILVLKHEVNELLGQTGLPPRYPSAESQDTNEE